MKSKTSKASKRFAQDVSANLMSLRMKRELTQEKLANKSGIDRKTINRIENGHFSPSMDTFFRICGALGVKPVDVMKSASKVKK